MKMKLQVTKQGVLLHAATYEVVDADSFGLACADAWTKLMHEQQREETSVGALMEHLENGVLGQLDGALIGLERVQ